MSKETTISVNVIAQAICAAVPGAAAASARQRRASYDAEFERKVRELRDAR